MLIVCCLVCLLGRVLIRSCGGKLCFLGFFYRGQLRNRIQWPAMYINMCT